MTYPRSHLVDPASNGVYHVQSRCVRRSWLCGFDPETGRDFSHRRAWLERRILELAELFSISIYGYAVMSNHYHIVLETRPQECLRWTDDEVVERWLALCPGRRPRDEATKDRVEMRRQALLEDAQRIAVLRDRLGSLSWFMRMINEPLARMANREDGCAGRFWQGRFASQRLLDEAAVLAAMVYVDLNPVRAGIAADVTECEYTSIHTRLQQLRPTDSLVPLNHAGSTLAISPITLNDYRSLVHWTARAQANVRSAGVLSHPSLDRRRIDAAQWMEHYLPRPGCWRRATGSLPALRHYAEALGQRWVQMRHATPLT